MPRAKRREWHNGGRASKGRAYSPFTRRIIWYDEGGDSDCRSINIRLKLFDCEIGKEWNLFPATDEEAEQIFQSFKNQTGPFDPKLSTKDAT